MRIMVLGVQQQCENVFPESDWIVSMQTLERTQCTERK